jgi:hypothetical protein
MRRRAAAGRDVLFLSMQPLADAAASGLLPLGAYPLRSTVLAGGKRGVLGGTKPRGGEFVLYRVQPS